MLANRPCATARPVSKKMAEAGRPDAAALTGIKLALDDPGYKAIEEQLGFGKNCFDAILKGDKNADEWRGAALRELRGILKNEDFGFSGLIKVLNKRQEFLWAHTRFAGEY